MSDRPSSRPGDQSPPSLGHVALHLAKEAGILAAAVEKMQHAGEHAAGVVSLTSWFLERAENLGRIERLVAAHFHGECRACARTWNDPEPGNTCPFCGAAVWLVMYGRVAEVSAPAVK